jgi:hypothetical protein
MTIQVALQSDLRRLIIQNLPHDRSDARLVAQLCALKTSELAIVYHNWLSRLVRPVPRRVLKSMQLLTNTLSHTFSTALADIEAAIENGDDLTPRLSKAVATYGYVAGSGSGTRDKDLMLNDWGVHHLHLGTGQDAKDPRFLGRTDELLFVIFRPDTAYLLDIVPHMNWTKQEIVRIAVTNWPGAELFLELLGIMAPSAPYTEAEHGKLRKAGVATPIEVDGRVYVARGMLSTAGTSIQSTRAADSLIETLERFEETCRVAPDKIEAMFSARGLLWPESPAFELVFLEDGVGVVEHNTGVVIGLK